MGSKLTIQEIRKRVEKCGWECVTQNYKNSKTPVEIKCSVGHKFELYLNNIKVDRVCPDCHGRNCIVCGAKFEGYFRKRSNKKSFISTRKYCEECRVIAQKKTKRRNYLKNRAKIIAKEAQKYKNNKEAKIEYGKNYYSKNKGKIQKRQREWEKKKREEAKTEKAEREKKLEDRKEGICPVCEKTFDPVTTSTSRAGNIFVNPRNIRKFCSKKCLNKFYKELKPKKAKEKKICKLCGKDFMALRSDKKFCSQNCKNLSTTKARRARWLNKNPHYTAFAHGIRKQCKPPWFETMAVAEIYKKRKKDENVDHIVPVMGKYIEYNGTRVREVCGLHCLANLTLLPKSDNFKKNNSLYYNEFFNSGEELNRINSPKLQKLRVKLMRESYGYGDRENEK